MSVILTALKDYIGNATSVKKTADLKSDKTVKFNSEELEENKDYLELNYPACDADKVADKCAFIKEFKITGLSGNEPAWYAALGVIRHCIDGENKCHEFSSVAHDYNQKLTDQKLYYLEQKAIQPTCCATVEQFGFCKDCKHVSRIKSPIQLGIVLDDITKETIEPEHESRAEELIKRVPTDGWLVGKQGIYRIIDDETVFVTAIPFFIVDKICESFDDETLLTVVIRFLMHGKPRNFRLSLKCLADPKRLEAEFGGRGIFIAERKYLKAYLIQYMNNLSDIEPYQAVNSMGWQPNGSFVYGSKGESFLSSDVPAISIMDSKVINYTRGFEAKGSIDKWKGVQSYFDVSDDFLPHVFSIMCSMGTPLLQFTAARGIVVSLQGDSGCAKTLAHEAAMSIWGNPETAGVLGTKDTHTAMVGRLGALKNLPVRLDEATTIEAKKLSSLIFELVNGRGRSRATIDGSLSNTAAEWRTLALLTTNSPLLDYSMIYLGEAERNRVLELEVKMPENMATIGRSIGGIIKQNYGLVGKELLEIYIKHKDKILKLIDKYQTRFQKLVGDDKRFWVSCGAIAFTAATVANMCKLYSFDINKLTIWFEGILREQTDLNSTFIEESRGFKERTEFMSALKDWLSGSILVLNNDLTINQSPVKEVKARLVKGTQGEVTLYVRAPVLKEFIQLHYRKSFSNVRKDMCIKDSAIKRFGSDTVRCYEFKLRGEN